MVVEVGTGAEVGSGGSGVAVGAGVGWEHPTRAIPKPMMAKRVNTSELARGVDISSS